MKGILNKFKGFISNDTVVSPSKKSPTSVSGEEGLTEENQKAKRAFFPTKKITPKTRETIVKECLYYAKYFKLFQALERQAEKDSEASTNFNVYFKENFKPISAVLKEKIRNQEEIDLASKEVNDLYKSYLTAPIKDENPLFCISVIGQRPNEESVLEYTYPDLQSNLNLDKELIEFFKRSIINSVMPDAVHHEDFVYFIIDLNKKNFEKLETEALLKVSKDICNDHVLLYGVSFFKQIPVTESMKQKNPELTGAHTQKAVCILSRVPLFGHILAKLDPVTKCYLLQHNHEDTQILKNLFDNINSSLKEITINLNELLTGTCTKKLVYFLKNKLMTLWKALFLEKRVLIFSQHPSACSTFIHSLLALYPCLLHFRYHSKALSPLENHYGEYGLPLRFFHEDCPVVPYFNSKNVDIITKAKGFLGGTSSVAVKNLPGVSWDILVDIDKNSIQFKNDSVKKAVNLTNQDKDFIQSIIKKVKSNNSAESLAWNNIESSNFGDVELGFKGSEDWIRHKFYSYLENFLTELGFFEYGTSAEKLDPHIDEFNAYLLNKDQVDDNFDWKDEILSPEDETGSRKDGEETEDDEIGTPTSSRSKSKSKTRSNKGGKRSVPQSQDDLEDFVQRTSQIDLEEKKAGEEKEAPKEPKKWFKSPTKTSMTKQAEFKSPQDAKTVLKKELMPLKDSRKILGKFGMDWILSWTTTSNFECWLDKHMASIGERSHLSRYAKNHVWCSENGDIYFGELREGQKTGIGHFLDKQTRLVFIGEWEENERLGNGKLISSENGEIVYEGGFSENKKHGSGKWNYNGEKYTGLFAKDKYGGTGTLVDKDQNTYQGEFKEGYKWGIGKLQLANGDFYTGEFMKNNYHGKGQLIHKNGDLYSGEFQDGMKWGNGILQTATGETYEGNFKNDKYDGSGKFTRKDGYIFEGLFRDGKLVDGEQGFIYHPDGSEYMGVIKDYKAHGYGTLTKFEGKQEIVVYGVFDSDQLIQEVSRVAVDPKGKKSEDITQVEKAETK